MIWQYYKSLVRQLFFRYLATFKQIQTLNIIDVPRPSCKKLTTIISAPVMRDNFGYNIIPVGLRKVFQQSFNVSAMCYKE